MFFAIADLAQRKIPFNVEYGPGKIDFLDPQLRQLGQLSAAGTAELFSEALGEVRIRGHITAQVGAPCDRCLEPASLAVDEVFDLYYRPADSEPLEEEREVNEEDLDAGFYEGDGIELADVLRELILLALPMQWTCRPDCRGLCAVCGANRNTSACECQTQAGDDRWAELKKLSR